MLFTVSPFLTSYFTPETGRITKVCPGAILPSLAMSFDQMMVLTETLNIEAIWDKLSPPRTT